MQPKFTPGPWESSACFERKRGDSYVVLAHDGIKVAECWVDAPSHDHEAEEATEADARLISAAPDLYAALASLLNAVGSPEHLRKHADAARAALRKADGDAL